MCTLNLSNCSVTDGLTCDRALGPGFGNLYFQNFGDFGIPNGATITHVRVRVTGKANVPSLGIYTGVSRVSSPILYYENCQFPSDTWTMYALNSNLIKEYNVTTPLTNGILATCFSLSNIRSSNYVFRVNRAGPSEWSANIDNFEIAFDYTPAPTPTPLPTVTPSPTPTPPEPFLDLPWDYESGGKSFEQQVFNPGSWFDHEYPLQNFCCNPPVLNYTGEVKDAFYRSHNGYDYSSQNGVVLGTEVLAAASGWATFKSESQSGGAGNVIKIDHGNGYQSWYEHLSNDNLIVSSNTGRVSVNKGQKIGEVGMTGNTTGPHIHFSVFKNSNGNSTFDDDYPWGFTDPLGWEGEITDPWTLWTSDPPEKENKRYGAKSYNLFVNRTPKKEQEVPISGGSVSLGNILLDIIGGTLDRATQFIMDYGPYETTTDGKIKSVMPSVFLNAFDNLGQEISQFNQPITLTYDYSNADLTNMNEDSLGIYWYNEWNNQWESLPSSVDLVNKKVFAQTTHFSQFSLMGEVKDLIPPTTNIIVSGEKGESDWYRSDVSVELLGQDNEDGVGLLYTLYTLNGSDWLEYKDPIIFSDEGTHEITYESYDKAENKEERKNTSFSIDKTPPEAEIKFNPGTLKLETTGIDSSGSADVDVLREDEDIRIKVTDLAGNMLQITGENEDEKENISSLNLDSLQYNLNPVIDLNSSRIWVKYVIDRETKVLKQLEQKFEVKGELKLRLIYSSKTGKTKVTTRIKGKEKMTQELTGIRILKLTSDWGTFKYSY